MLPGFFSLARIEQILTDIALAIRGDSASFKGFFYHSSAAQSVANATFTVILFDTKVFDLIGSYNTANGRFTPRVAGYYQFISGIGLLNAGDQSTIHTVVRKNGVNQAWTRVRMSGTGEAQGTISEVVYLDGVTDYIDFAIYTSGGATSTTFGISNTWAQGYLLK